MSQRKKESRKSKIKQRQFRDRNISLLDDHHREGNKFKTPWSKIPGTVKETHSWISDCIPNILWACILAATLDREEYLALFRSVVIKARENFKYPDRNFVTHNYLSTLTVSDFSIMFSAVLANDRAKANLAALRLVETLPDGSHWVAHLPEIDPEAGWQILAAAVAQTFDHQSEKSTDIRWMKLMYLLVSGRVHVAESMSHIVEEVRLFPNKGDMRQVRPSIRAFEIGFRDFEFGDTKIKHITLPPGHQVAFWAEVKTKTQCILAQEFIPPAVAPKNLVQEIMKIMEAAQIHFMDTAVTTDVDAKHDAAFGLTLYALTLFLNLTLAYGHNIAEGRIVLRSIAEVFITLRYLAKKDDPAIWLQYRQYGSGQAKLAFLKNIKESDVPAFLDLRLIESLANEDMWMEFQDIQIGSWANLNLRKMAEEAKAKDVYDKFYDWASGYVHGHWISVRNTCFVNCMNPLHRFHRIPGPPVTSMPSVLIDACRLINRALNELNALFPPFKSRLKWHRKSSNAQG